jgi:sodium pump decarboxylase gamma subunit
MTFLAVNWGNALLITGVGFGLVFLVLVLLIFIVKSFGVIFAQKPKAQAAAVAAPAATEATDETDMAAIAYVLHTFYNQHDEESDVLTIRHDDVAYSPWNQKSITF